MIMTKKTVISAAAATVAVAGFGLYGARASALADSRANPHQTLAQSLASTFGLDASKVQSAITGYRTGNYEQHLQSAVTAGKLTPAQEQAILAEHNTLAGEITAAQGLTGSARRAALQKVRTDAQAWAQANGVSAHWLLAPNRPHLRGGRGQTGSPTPSPSPSPSPSV